jgi:hypothetical protein
MAQKSILEQALLQVQTLEEAVKANAKGILASTMKQELNDLLKEQEDEDPEKEEKDVPEFPGDDETSISDEKPTDDESPEGAEELPSDEKSSEDEIPSEGGEELPAMGGEEGGEGEEDFLDMTGASEEEVLKVFKAMKPEDGIVVKKDGNTVQFSDDGNDYIIKLDDEGEETPEMGENPEVGEGPEHEAGETPGEEDAEHEGPNPEEMPDELEEQEESNEELVYEIELGEDKNDPFSAGKVPVKGVKKLQANEAVALPTKSPNKSDPFEKSSPQVGTGVKKLQTTVTTHKVAANEQETGVDKWSGTPVPGTGNPETKEPGKGGTKVTQSEKHDGVPPKGTKPAEKKEPGKGGGNAKQVEDHPGTPVKGEGKPVVKQFGEEEECTECGGKKMEATEAARTKWNPHGNKPKDGPKRAGLPSKKLFKAGSTEESINEEVEILRKQNGEYRKALILFKDKLNEVAVFNANLAYATRLFTEHSTTKQEKLNILQRFDSISTITESKNLYASIKGELETKKPISESAVEKIASTPTSSSTEMLSESKAYENPQFKRMKELMAKMK